MIHTDDVRLYHAVDGVGGRGVSVTRVSDVDTASVSTRTNGDVLPIVVSGISDLQSGNQCSGRCVYSEDLGPARAIVMGVKDVFKLLAGRKAGRVGNIPRDDMGDQSPSRE